MTAVASSHARYRAELELLAGRDAFALAADEACARWSWPEGRSWRRMHERFDPDREPYATCVLASEERPQRIVRLEAFHSAPPEPRPGAVVVRAGAAGRLRASRFPSDPALPTLARALADSERSTVVRYRPGRRCTIRVDGDRGTRFLKVYADAAAQRAHVDGVRLWQAARQGLLGFAVAEPGRFDPGLRAVWQGPVVGRPVRDRLYEPDGEELARRLGVAAGTLAAAGVRTQRRRGRRSELAVARLRCADLARRVPVLAEPARRLLAALEAALSACDAAEPRPVHGALHLSQWLANGAGVALLDYDTLALGDPELDAATFLADVDVLNRERYPVDRLAAAFLSGFEASAGPLDARLLTAHRAHRRLEKALRVARAIRPDGDRKAERRVRRAIELLAGHA